MEVFIRVVIGTLQDDELLPFSEHDINISSNQSINHFMTDYAGWDAFVYLVVKLDEERQYKFMELTWDPEICNWITKQNA